MCSFTRLGLAFPLWVGKNELEEPKGDTPVCGKQRVVHRRKYGRARPWNEMNWKQNKRFQCVHPRTRYKNTYGCNQDLFPVASHKYIRPVEPVVESTHSSTLVTTTNWIQTKYLRAIWSLIRIQSPLQTAEWWDIEDRVTVLHAMHCYFAKFITAKCNEGHQLELWLQANGYILSQASNIACLWVLVARGNK